ncbi:CsgE family curli-type amyloid fiber assembly protein [Shewanella sp. Koi 1]
MRRIHNIISTHLMLSAIFSTFAMASEAPFDKAVSEETFSLQPLTEGKNINENSNDEKLAEGLILNRTVTRLGYNFYRQFVSTYRDIGGETEHSGLTVVEQPTARSGSRITILHNRKPIFTTFASPVSRYIYLQAESAAKRIDIQLKQIKEEAKFVAFENPDLAPDEF